MGLTVRLRDGDGMIGGDTEALIDEAIVGLRDAVLRRVLGGPPATRELNISSLVRFSPRLAPELSEARRAELVAAIEALGPWRQGPFLVGGDLVAGRSARDDERWLVLGEQIDPDLSGRRVLDLGSQAGYDAFMLHLRGPEHVLACESGRCREQALLLESIYETGVEFQALEWRDLERTRHGRFDLIHCRNVLHRERNPLGLLERLRALLAPGGTLWLGSALLPDPQLSEYARFVPSAYGDDPSWWWVPGRLALRWMIETAGLAIQSELEDPERSSGEFPVVRGYVRATPAAS